MGMLVIWICAQSIPREQCDDTNARLAIHQKAQSAFCAERAPLWMALLSSGIGPTATEYPRIRCIEAHQ